MDTTNTQNRDFSSRPKNKQSAFPRHNGFIAAILILAPVIGCTSEPTPTQTFVHPTSMPNCLPRPVFTAADMRANVDCHPDKYKTEITKDTVVLFAFPNPTIDWAGSISIVHIPSISGVTLNSDGSIFSRDYKSSTGQSAIEEVLNNKELMSSILERAKEIQK